VRLQGIANFHRSGGHKRAKQGENIAAPVLPDLQGKGHVRQRSLSTDLIFGSLYQDKEQSHNGKRYQRL
jgi:hypothetical protein